ncbi:MerR family transcriptional regulator [Paenibacillus alkaliterrae]|uniref:MerR family transcriptional regulator n=1 Tax=Paenibacillus alkaliterrae TaxID=320909 RepID=UPI001F1890A7|nr:methyltransferase domain-containing protein [Paenibacillus alkaliterrae]MCF2941464.1 MerR family transcriptional regulator [Paenibacillus alkaliterrae]
MKIKEIADKLKISARTIRFYEEKGLIDPSKQENNQYRDFNEKDIWRLQTIISLREAGMTVGDIKKALKEIEGQDIEELQYYLELQRSVMFSKWLEIKQIIETTDYMIHIVKNQKPLPLDDIYELAEGSKRLREQRVWRDKWNFDRLASIHDQRVLNDSLEYKNYEEALDLTVKWLSPTPGEKGLDIGTGTGNLAGKLIEQGANMAGVDQSKEMLKQCQKKLPDMETKLGNFLAIPYLDGKFDFVVSSFAFHHLTEEQKILGIEEMRRVLKPHGRICITDLMLANEQKPDDPDNGQNYTPLGDLLNLFEKIGYITKHQRINELLHIVYAVPIR